MTDREQAIERGQQLGVAESDWRGEIGTDREERVKRAQAYAAWDFDGRNSDGEHLREFGVGQEVTPSLERAIFGRLLKKEKK